MSGSGRSELIVAAGAMLIIVAMVAGTAVAVWAHPPVAVRTVVLAVALVAVLAGGLMTLHDRR